MISVKTPVTPSDQVNSPPQNALLPKTCEWETAAPARICGQPGRWQDRSGKVYCAEHGHHLIKRFAGLYYIPPNKHWNAAPSVGAGVSEHAAGVESEHLREVAERIGRAYGDVDWFRAYEILKCAFPLSASNPDASEEEIARLWQQARAYAHCNCPENPRTGVVDYHSNCAKRLMPILDKLEATIRAKAAPVGQKDAVWICGCGAVNGVNLSHCRACNRTTDESIRDCKLSQEKEAP